MSLSPGQAHDGVEGWKLLESLGRQEEERYLVMDRAYEGNQTRQLARDLGYVPVVPPRRHRKIKWEYDLILYGKRNVVERLNRLLKGFRRVCTRYDKLDLMYLGFVLLACIFEAFFRKR